MRTSSDGRGGRPPCRPVSWVLDQGDLRGDLRSLRASDCPWLEINEAGTRTASDQRSDTSTAASKTVKMHSEAFSGAGEALEMRREREREGGGVKAATTAKEVEGEE